jgi:hypothetical protein
MAATHAAVRIRWRACAAGRPAASAATAAAVSTDAATSHQQQFSAASAMDWMGPRPQQLKEMHCSVLTTPSRGSKLEGGERYSTRSWHQYV